MFSCTVDHTMTNISTGQDRLLEKANRLVSPLLIIIIIIICMSFILPQITFCHTVEFYSVGHQIVERWRAYTQER